MNEESESWESASYEKLTIDPKKSPKKKKILRNTKIRILHQILLVSELLKMPRKYMISKSQNIFEKYRQIKEKYTCSEYGSFNGFLRGENKLCDQNISYALTYKYLNNNIMVNEHPNLTS